MLCFLVIRTLHLLQPLLYTALSALLCALLHKSEAHPLAFHTFAHSLCKTPGCHQERFSNLVFPKWNGLGKFLTFASKFPFTECH